MSDLLAKFMAWVESTHIQEQVNNVDYVGLFTNPWFLVPFVCAVLYLLYKQDFRDLILIVTFLAVWWVSGTEYMDTLVVGEELQLAKIVPVMFGGVAVIGFVIYLFFGRSD